MHTELQSIAVVEQGGLVQVQVQTSRPAGTQVRVILLEIEEPIPGAALALARLQEQSGFAGEVLADPVEDVWNDL
ncbi:MAG: hypothetical protein IPL99_04050 [Candidatus Competibacteraceae bacterium]|nr:hypothetical protein [Candidatus Competibacteraceae bacterium]